MGALAVSVSVRRGEDQGWGRPPGAQLHSCPGDLTCRPQTQNGPHQDRSQGHMSEVSGAPSGHGLGTREAGHVNRTEQRSGGGTQGPGQRQQLWPPRSTHKRPPVDTLPPREAPG